MPLSHRKSNLFLLRRGQFQAADRLGANGVTPRGTAVRLRQLRRIRQRSFFWTGLLYAVLTSHALHADVVVLHNGNRIHGEVLQDGPRELALKFSGGIIQIPRKQIDRIERESRIDYLLELSETQMGRENFDQALKTLAEAEKEGLVSDRVERNLIVARHGLGGSLLGLERYGEARTIFERVLRDDPTHAGAAEGIRQIDTLLAEADREEKKARLEIRRGELESGVGRLSHVYERFPERREVLAPVLSEALAIWADSLLGKGNWEDAEQRYAAALEIHPDVAPLVRLPFTAIKLQRVQALAREGRFEEVAKAAAAGLEVAPAHKGLRFYAGLALESDGKKREAAEAYLAVSGERRPARIEAAVGELRRAAETALVEAGAVNPTAHPNAHEATGNFRTLRSRHFEVVHRNNTVAREIAQIAEGDYVRLFNALRCPTDLRTRIRLTVYPTKQEYLDASGMASWSGGAHMIEKVRGNLSEHHISCYQDQARLLSGILTHEVAHALLSHRVNNKTLPLWANEGFAVYSEPLHLHRHYMKILKKERARQTLVPLRKVLSRREYPQDKVELYYGQSFSVVDFLIQEKGLHTFVQFLLTLNDDNLAAMVKRHYRIPGINALENRWLAWIDFWG